MLSANKLPFIRKKQRLNRYRWAKLKANWNKDDWRGVTFSDKTYIELNAGNKARFVRRAKSERIIQKHTNSRRTIKQRLLVWGCITNCGPGPIEVLKGTLDGSRYLSLIKRNIIPFQKEVGIVQ